MKFNFVQKSHLVIVFLFALFVASEAFCGNAVGNGGDHVRAMFIRMGEVISEFISDTDEGQKLLAETQLSLEQLKAQNTIQVISVSEEILIDNGGSIVDAIGEPSKIILSKDKWMDHFENNRDIYFLVLHELLRAAGINDDDYRHSKIAQNFPDRRKILTRIGTQFPILDEISLSKIIQPEKIIAAGGGCPAGIASTSADFDPESNSFALTFHKYGIIVGNGGASAGKKACLVRIPVSPPAGSRVTIAHIDFSAKGILGTGAEVTSSARGTYAGQQLPIERKSFRAEQSTKGKLLHRLDEKIASNCDGIGEILSVDTALSVIAKSMSEKSIFSGEKLNIYFKVEPCISKNYEERQK